MRVSLGGADITRLIAIHCELVYGDTHYHTWRFLLVICNMLPIGSLSKEELLVRIRASGCTMLNGLKLEEMRRSQILEHLQKCNCPELKKIISLHSK